MVAVLDANGKFFSMNLGAAADQETPALLLYEAPKTSGAFKSLCHNREGDLAFSTNAALELQIWHQWSGKQIQNLNLEKDAHPDPNKIVKRENKHKKWKK